MSLPSTAATISTPTNKRLQRTSNPTPPEREGSNKSCRNNYSSSKKNMEMGKLDESDINKLQRPSNCPY